MFRNHIILIVVALVLIVVAFSRAPIAQDPRYHAFADTRTVLGISNGVNVLSNLPFVLAGVWGLIVVLNIMRSGGTNNLLVQYLLFFAGVLLSGIGSISYHLDPSNGSLVWDRLPMSIAFMALLSSVMSECIDRKVGSLLLPPLVMIGSFSVVYWSWSEQAGQGDLRLYAIVQFLPVVLVPLILILYRPTKAYAVSLWLLAGLYIVSKVFELLDCQVYAVALLVSGHTLKHVIAALGVGFVVHMVSRRREELLTGLH
jgi:hypothetical protein